MRIFGSLKRSGHLEVIRTDEYTHFFSIYCKDGYDSNLLVFPVGKNILITYLRNIRIMARSQFSAAVLKCFPFEGFEVGFFTVRIRPVEVSL